MRGALESKKGLCIGTEDTYINSWRACFGTRVRLRSVSVLSYFFGIGRESCCILRSWTRCLLRIGVVSLKSVLLSN